MSKQEQASWNSICRPTSAEKDWSVSNYLPPAIYPDYHQAEIVSAYIVEDNEKQQEYSKFGDERNILELETKCVLLHSSIIFISLLTKLS